MTLLPVEMLVRCLQSNVKVDVKESCFPCRHYSHMTYIGKIPQVCCIYPKTRETVREEEKEAL